MNNSKNKLNNNKNKLNSLKKIIKKGPLKPIPNATFVFFFPLEIDDALRNWEKNCVNSITQGKMAKVKIK